MTAAEARGSDGDLAVFAGHDGGLVPEGAGAHALGKVLSDNLSGIDGESVEVRGELLERARKYAAARKVARKNKGVFQRKLVALSSAQDCDQRASDAFCAFYHEVGESTDKSREVASGAEVGDDLNGGAPRMVTTRSLKKIGAWLHKGDVAALSGVMDRDLRKAISKQKGFEKLEAVAEKALAEDRCSKPTLTMMLGAKAEEAFPEETLRKRAVALYEKAASCSSDPRLVSVSARASYRLSLLSIWEGKCEQALPQLDWLIANESKHEFGSRALYWQARCMEAAKNTSGMEAARKSLRERHPFSLHNIVMQGNDPEMIKAISRKPDPKVAFRSAGRPEINSSVLVAEALLASGESGVAGEVLRRVSARAPELEPEFRLYLAVLLNRAGQYVEKFRVLAPLFKERPEYVSRSALELYYPQNVVANYIPTEQQGLEMDPMLMLSLIRQESAFNRGARSPAGALGLMQVMPSTARLFGRVRKSQLLDPSVNMKIGSKYFALLARRFDGDVELALAAYNAGPRKVDDWLRRYPVDNRILFIDLIPFKETREYVASIARNYYWYSILYPVPVAEGDRKDSSGGFRVFGQGAVLSAVQN